MSALLSGLAEGLAEALGPRSEGVAGPLEKLCKQHCSKSATKTRNSFRSFRPAETVGLYAIPYATTKVPPPLFRNLRYRADAHTVPHLSFRACLAINNGM